MRNLLLGGTALVAAGAVAAGAPQQANAADPIQLEVGGYYDFFYTVTAQDEPAGQANDFQADRIRQEGEVEFRGSTTLDNGIQVGIDVALKAYTDPEQIEEHYIFVDGSFGSVELGSRENAAYLMHYAAPEVGILANSPDYLPFQNFTGIFPKTYVGGTLSNRFNRINYFTPRIAGFQLGASYAPDAGTPDNQQTPSGTGLLTDGRGNMREYAIGANFVRSFNGIDVAASAGYNIVTNDSGAANAEDGQDYSFGLNVGYAGFTFGGSFEQQDAVANRPGTAGFNPAFGESETTLFDIGASYTTGPWGTSIAWVRGEREFDNSPAEPTMNSVVGSLTYELGPGITANANVHYFQQDADGGPAAPAGEPNYDEGAFAGSIGMFLSF
jgi:hypothetical protein